MTQFFLRSAFLFLYSILMLWQPSAAGLVSKVYSLDRNPVNNEATVKFDYIVVGGGGAGCTVARTLADSGFSVLVVERGSDSSDHHLVDDIYGAGLVINDRTVAQPVTTAQGVVSHAASVLGGGTAVGFGIWIEETEEYFNLLQRDYRVAEKMNINLEFAQNSPPIIGALSYSRILDAFSWLRRELGIEPKFSQNTEPSSRRLESDNFNEGEVYATGSNSAYGYSSQEKSLKIRQRVTAIRKSSNENASLETSGLLSAHTRSDGRLGYSNILRDTFSEPDNGVTSHLENGKQWEPLSLFVDELDESDGQGDGTQRKVKKRHHAGYLVNKVEGPGSLTILLNSTAEKVTFEGEERRATCVQLKSTSYSDVRRTGEVPPGNTPGIQMVFEDGEFKSYIDFSVPASIFDSYSDQHYTYPEFAQERVNYTEMTVCLRNNSTDKGDIIITSGALQTPLLLLRSGIGAKRDLERLHITHPVLLNDHVGQNLLDRLMTPISFYLPSNSAYKKMLEEPVICETAAISGSACPSVVGDGDGEGSCLISGFEELSGGRLVEGFLLASKLAIPLALRNSEVADTLETVIRTCQDILWNSTTGSKDEGLHHWPHDDSEFRQPPRAPGSLVFPPVDVVWNRLKTPGARITEDDVEACQFFVPLGNCMDRQMGWVNLQSDIRSRGSISISETGKPIIDPKYLTTQHDMDSAVFGIKKLIERAKKLAASGMFDAHSTQRDSDCPAPEMEPLFNRIEQLSMTPASRIASPSSSPPLAATIPPLSERVGLLKKTPMPDACMQGISNRSEDTWYGDYIPVCRSEWDSVDETLMSPFLEIRSSLLVPGGKEMESSVPLTTFPPYLPDPSNTAEMEQFVRAYSTSMWHWSGSASLGSVVDSNFDVYGAVGLKIIDSSVFTRLTRMNPTASYMAVARSAALLMADQRRAQM